MRHELPCVIVRDLLPNYIEGLTSEESSAAIRAHLDTCPDCAALLAAMSEPEREAAQQAREVDYLKTVKRKGRRRLLLAVLCTLTILLAGFAVKLFVIGEPATQEGLSWSAREETNALELRAFSNWSGVAYCRWKVENTDGIVKITASKVLPSPLYSDADHRERIPLEGVKEVWLFDHLLWQEGVIIRTDTRWLYETRTPYVGDISALSRITAQLPTPPQLGSYTSELQTSQHPYRWTFRFLNAGNSGPEKDDLMRRYAIVYLALVENLEEVGWVYSDGAAASQILTLDDAVQLLTQQTDVYNKAHATDWAVPASIKDCAASPAALQKLLNILEL